MRFFVLAAALCAFPAQAEIYRWIDRETGTVKFSNIPPPWYGDPEKERGAPAVEVIRGPATPAKPAAQQKPAVTVSTLGTLEARWTELGKFFAALPPGTDFATAGTGLQRLIQDYQALSAELDRVDPAGTPRRRAQEAMLFKK
jgi:hypothetical protein